MPDEDPVIAELSFRTHKDTVSLEEDPVTKQCKIVKKTEALSQSVDKNCTLEAEGQDCDIVYPPRFRGSGTGKTPIRCPACMDPIWGAKAAGIQCMGRRRCFKQKHMPTPCTDPCEDQRFPCNVCEDAPPNGPIPNGKEHTLTDGRIAELLKEELTKFCILKVQGGVDDFGVPNAIIKIRQLQINVTIKGNGSLKIYDDKLTVIQTINKELKGIAIVLKSERTLEVKAIALSGKTDWTPVNQSKQVIPVIRGGTLARPSGSIVWLNPGNQSPSFRMSMICPTMKDIDYIYGFDNFTYRVRVEPGGAQIIVFDQREPLSIEELLPQGKMNLKTLQAKSKQTSSISNWPPKFVEIAIPPNLTSQQIAGIAGNAGGRDKPLEVYYNIVNAVADSISNALSEAATKYNIAVNSFLATAPPAGGCAFAFEVPGPPTIEIKFIDNK